VLPPYAEIVRFDDRLRLSGDDLAAAARTSLRQHLDRAPRVNPFIAFGEQLEGDLPRLLDGEQNDYHDYAFATVRMAGAGFELCGAHVRWLMGGDADVACDAFGSIVDAAKLLSFKLARRRPFDPSPVVDQMADAWARAFGALREGIG
jgi:Domain of unknown function (DUF1839)